ncbi:oligoendopeptidase F [Fundicoccus culcitae]|uniref:Oligopeptidase F n=1 Tax=Fundicoccus culcitae TaxID=2969821 RepID=A0ABY5P9A4_9LACT|nr:oligoendopeptidase F [Fundicoccus culcitae]UUX35327.1 oligoendopeptidase F [Fundicoccus culcitae]
MSQALPLRSELPEELTWDLSLLFKSQADFEAALGQLKELVNAFAEKYRDIYFEKGSLLQALKDYEAIQELAYPVFGYANLGYEVDKLNETYEQNETTLMTVSEWMGQKLAFFLPALAKVDAEIFSEVVDDPEGVRYQYFLREVRRVEGQMLDEQVESVLSGLDGSIFNQSRLYGAMKFQDLAFDDFEVDGVTYANSFPAFEGDWESHLNPGVRHGAWKSFHDGLRKFENTAAANYINHVQTEKKIATLRGYESVFDYLLFDQQVTQEAYHRQIDVIMEKFAPVMQRYARLLQKEHKLEKISLADIKMPFSPEESAKISVADSRTMIEDAFQVMGEEYSAVVTRAFDERWIDYPMNKTKSTGGFCSTIYGGPSYILLNWTGLLSEVLVLAHELGHAGHFQLTHKNQSVLTPDVSTYFVEAPSTANEVIMCQYLLNQPIEAKQKQILIAEFISRTYYHNMVTHLLEADFQRKVYRAIDAGELLNAASLNRFFKETLEQFWGDAVEINEGAELTWMRQPHYFMGLYSYTYSAGLTIGTSIGQRIALKEDAAVSAWLDVLKAGGTKTPLELADMAGVSMHDEQTLLSAIGYVDQLLDQIEALG